MCRAKRRVTGNRVKQDHFGSEEEEEDTEKEKAGE